MSMTMVTGGTSGINSDLQLIKMVLNSNVNVPDVALQHILDMPTQLALTGLSLIHISEPTRPY